MKNMKILAPLLVLVVLASAVGCSKSEDSAPLPPSPGAEKLNSAGGDNVQKKSEGAAASEGL